jgi:hypothetical protein
MKKVLLSSLILFSTSAFAMGVNFPSMQFPKESGWAIGMVSRACDIPLRELKQAKGKIRKTSNGVLYTVYLNGGVYAQAKAKNTSIFAKKNCL